MIFELVPVKGLGKSSVDKAQRIQLVAEQGLGR